MGNRLATADPPSDNDGMSATPRREPLVLLGLTILALAVSAIRPFDTFTWSLEIAPVVLAIPLLWLTARRFPLTPLAYRLIFVHALILIYGGHYTYEHAPLGNWVRDMFDLARNHYDRLGHFVQGFVPAIIVREILVRKSPLRPGGWLFFLVASVCLAISSFYEFIEWWTSVASGAAADAFLATQGDVWDTQWDMFLALCGAIIAQLVFGRLHDRHLARLAENTSGRV
jgi:putative membrane protein